MSAVWYRLRAEARVRWRSWLALAVLIGAVGATSLAAAAGARRTDSAYDRFLVEQDAYDVALTNYPTDDGIAVFDFDAIEALPEVVDSARGSFDFSPLSGGTAYLFSEDDRLGTEFNRQRIIEGRRADPAAPEEATIGFDLADEQDIEVGDEIQLIEPQYHDLPQLQDLLAAVPEAKVRVVGIEASPGEFPPQFGSASPLIHLTPAFGEIVGGAGGEFLALRLAGGAAAVDGFLHGVEERSGGLPFFPIIQQEQAASVERSIDLQVVALWMFAGVVAGVGVLVIAQLLARNALLETVDNARLRALGLQRRQLVVLAVVRAGLVGLVASSVAVVGAALASPLTPIGLARVAEPDPGFDVDIATLALGGLAVLVLTVLLSIVPAWLVARRRPRAVVAARPGWPARATAALHLRPVRAVGTRMALEPGHGPTAVPVRTTIAALAVGVTTLTGVLVFGASLSHLLDSPDLYGQSWDVEASDFEHDWTPDEIPDDPRIVGAGIGDTGLPIELDGDPSGALLFELVRGSVGPPVLDGRLPSEEGEIAIGRRTARDLGLEIGDRVDVRLPPNDGTSMLVVGEVVLPSVGDRTNLGEGAVLHPSAMSLLAGEGGPPDSSTVYLALADGADPAAVLDDLNRATGTGIQRLARADPNDIVNFGRVEGLPWLLAGVVVAFTVATLANTLWVASRRRARDLAVLRSLGFRRRQVRATSAWQAVVFAALALAVGIPAGIVIGRWSWILLADRIGVVARPEVPPLVVGVLLPAATLAVAALLSVVAWAPRRRSPPIELLRSE
jgi:putative ABC transport system permease protein